LILDPAIEQPRELAPGASEAVTVAFADSAADVCGVARVGIAEVDGQPTASGMALLFVDGEPVAVRAQGGTPLSGQGWDGVRAAGVHTTITTPLQSWTMAFSDEDGATSFELELTAHSEAARLDRSDPVAQLGGMEGYEQLVTVAGTVRAHGTTRLFRGRGQRGHSWGAPDWTRLSMARTMGVWLDDDSGLSLTAVRPAKGTSHADEKVHAALLDRLPDESLARAIAIADPRLSTTYDGEGRQRHAGLELYMDGDDDHARRAAGEVVCGTTLDLGSLRLDCAFLRWHMEGRTGVGRYDVLRRVS
jgi:hypothetical protein